MTEKNTLEKREESLEMDFGNDGNKEETSLEREARQEKKNNSSKENKSSEINTQEKEKSKEIQAIEKEKQEYENKPDEQKKEIPDGVIYVGKKPITSYSIVLKNFLIKDKKPEAKVEARGKLVSKAINIVEFFRKRMTDGQEIKVKDIQISSNGVKNKENKTIYVPKIEIILAR